VVIDVSLLRDSSRILQDIVENHNASVITLSAKDDVLIYESLIEFGSAACLDKRVAPKELCDAIRVASSGKVMLSRSAIAMFYTRLNNNVHGTRVLNHREIEILKLIAQGKRSKTIASILNISTQTVQTHSTNILKKLGATSKCQAIILGCK